MNNEQPSEQVIVIGAGISGLATAALLARRGYSVTVVDKQETTGGRIGEINADGFRFETGPSWYLMPEAYEQFFRLLGTSVDEQFNLTTLDPAYRLWTGPEEFLDIPYGAEKVAALFESIEPGAGKKLTKYLRSAHLVYAIALDNFLYTTFRSPKPLLNPTVLLRTSSLVRYLFEPLQRFVDKQFSDHRLRKILQYPAVFLSTQPATAPSMYHLMSHTDLQLGVKYPEGGFRAIVNAVEKLAREFGVVFALNTEVTKLECSQGRVNAVHVISATGQHEILRTDLVVSTADLHHTETALLPREYQTHPETAFAKQDPGIGTVLAMLGVQGKLPELAHHSLVLSPHWEKDFHAIFSPAGALAVDKVSSSIYVCKPSASDDTVAPDGHENLFVLIPTAADVGIGHGSGYPRRDDVASEAEARSGVNSGAEDGGDASVYVSTSNSRESATVSAIVDGALETIMKTTGVTDLCERIVSRHTLGPADFADDFHSWRGGALGPAHTLKQSAMFRAQNKSQKLENLYYAGATVAPGVGVPMCLISAENVLKRIDGRTDSRPMLADEVRRRH